VEEPSRRGEHSGVRAADHRDVEQGGGLVVADDQEGGDEGDDERRGRRRGQRQRHRPGAEPRDEGAGQQHRRRREVEHVPVAVPDDP